MENFDLSLIATVWGPWGPPKSWMFSMNFRGGGAYLKQFGVYVSYVEAGTVVGLYYILEYVSYVMAGTVVGLY